MTARATEIKEQLPVITNYKPTAKQKAEKWEQALKALSDIIAVKIAPSSIHGVGTFAVRDIKKGEMMDFIDAVTHAFDLPWRYVRKLDKEKREILLSHFPNILNGSHFFYPVTKFSAYLNHSDDPNYDNKTRDALRDIKAGEEITENYRVIPKYEKVYSFLKKK